MSDNYQERIEALAEEARQCFSQETEASLDAISDSRRTMTEYIEVSRRTYSLMLTRMEEMERELYQERLYNKTLSDRIAAVTEQSKAQPSPSSQRWQLLIAIAVTLLLATSAVAIYIDFTAPYKPTQSTKDK